MQKITTLSSVLRRFIQGGSILSLSLTSLWVDAAGIPTLNEMLVRANARELIGSANSANEGTVLKHQLDLRTVYRPGELLETVPGLIVTQHSGEGKANQYFLRGFNLDHGTDLRITVDGMLVNQRSHGHGQGWADTNFIIPELIGNLQYMKGPYYAHQGDFSSAGAVSMGYLDKLPKGIASYGLGQQGFMRGLVTKSHEVGRGNVLYAVELLTKDGPWVKHEDFKKFNAVLRYSQDTGPTKFNVTAMGYGGNWNSTDQIPARGVASGFIPRLGAIDPSSGGESHRFSLSTALQHSSRYGITQFNLYTLHSNLALFSNFTYFLDDPVNGDQFSQIDKRFQSAMNVDHLWVSRIKGIEIENTVGVQFQNDVINNGLLSTKERQTLSTTRKDHINQNSVGIFYQNSIQWLEKFRSVAGVRSDYYWFDVNSNLNVNSGNRYDSMTNPKLGLIFGPWVQTELYFNYGSGFHSNDARGTTSIVDPKSGDSINRVNPLVRSTGYEVGVRTAIIPGLQASFAAFRLDLDSELLFVGDAGTTEASRPSKREGFEVSLFYMPKDWLTIDIDYALARARFSDDDPSGNYIPGAIRGVGKMAVSVDNIGRFFGSMQVRYFGKRSLIEDNSVQSNHTVTLNGQIGYKIGSNVRVILQGFNLLNTHAHAIDYYYASRLPGEPTAGVNDVHFHPIESRSLRVNLVANF
ncbi:TonB-dependent receptor [Nitrosomonas ureae]|uniref:Outer membrane receptor protein involved in Fe transport n=1 Tax=Nitrosomonas ureae TaxID=44577 RepID=A0A286ABN2_9PROT|nr:TonB-dependent receptor [Nitrosomonas ureae]PTQ85877.1 outer membrane receptor protein involved in Fe transport [Nitrosomonas ureae]SOD19309.1 Outer membrane receptor proteins, mostly Fe transport [Nitrosomonas ureae]